MTGPVPRPGMFVTVDTLRAVSDEIRRASSSHDPDLLGDHLLRAADALESAALEIQRVKDGWMQCQVARGREHQVWLELRAEAEALRAEVADLRQHRQANSP